MTVYKFPADGRVDPAPIDVPQPPFSQRLRPWLIAAILIGLLGWSFSPVEIYKITALVTDWRNMAEFLQGFLKPNFHEWRQYLGEMLETVQIAIWGTALAVIIAAPLAILASSNVAPAVVVQPVRRFMDAARAINEIVFALLFVVAVGLGPLAGVLALAVHNIGIIAKLFSEAVEAIDPRPVEGIHSTGASRLQVVIYGIIPQVMPLWSSFTLYRFETNVRSATVLGIVGAGGVGHSLYENIRSFNYSETAAIVIIIVCTVMMIDLLSSRIRAALV